MSTDPSQSESSKGSSSRVSRWLQSHSSEQYGTDPDQLDTDFVARCVENMKWLYGPKRYFRLTVTGWENLPDSPCILVSNHSGGTSIPDVWGLSYAWFSRFGPDRICHPLAHEMVFSNALTGRPLSKLGVLRASPTRALDVLTKWKRDVLVFPGGDADTWRKWTDRYQVNFANRKGYARLSLQTGLPIVPIAHAGAHDSLVVLTDGRRFARSIQLHKIARADVFPIHLSFPWGLGIGPLPHLPAPVHLRYSIGAPIFPPEQIPNLSRNDPRIEPLNTATLGAIQDMLDTLKEQRPRTRHRIKALSKQVYSRFKKKYP
jgi:1-acyl-sn-glycerol-3-phosphate acyltransferase